MRQMVPSQVVAFARPSDRFVRLSQLQPGPVPLGATPPANDAVQTQPVQQDSAQQDVIDKRNLGEYRKTLANLEKQIVEYNRMIQALEKQIIERQRGTKVA